MDRSGTCKYSFFYGNSGFSCTHAKVMHFLSLNIMIKFLYSMIIITVHIFQMAALGFAVFFFLRGGLVDWFFHF